MTTETLDESCPKCGQELTVRLGRRGRFVGCSGYPDCDYTRNLNDEAGAVAEPELVEGRSCPECGSPLAIKVGRYGKFIGCTGYPSATAPAQTGVDRRGLSRMWRR